MLVSKTGPGCEIDTNMRNNLLSIFAVAMQLKMHQAREGTGNVGEKFIVIPIRRFVNLEWCPLHNRRRRKLLHERREHAQPDGAV